MCEDVRLQVSRLGKFLVAAIEGADVRAVSCVDAHVGAQIKVQRESLATALKRALETGETELMLPHQQGAPYEKAAGSNAAADAEPAGQRLNYDQKDFSATAEK